MDTRRYNEIKATKAMIRTKRGRYNNMISTIKSTKYVGRFTSNDIQDFLEEYVRQNKKKNYLINIAVLYRDNFKSGQLTNIREGIPNVPLLSYVSSDGNDVEQDEFTEFVITTINTKNKGGCSSISKSNNCLYSALKCLMKKRFTEEKYCQNPVAFKKFLKLGMNEFVPVSSIPLVEDLIQTKINVEGDCTYISNKNHNREVTIRITAGHFTPVYSKQPDLKIYGVDFKEKKIAMIYNDTYDRYYYNGEYHYDFSKGKYLNSLNNPSKSEFIYIVARSLNIEEEYNDFINSANELKEATNAKINLYITGSYQNTAINLFNEMSQPLAKVVEEIDLNESEWLENATQGARVEAVPYEGEAYKYDVASFYPSTLCTMSIPLKRGEFKLITQNEFNEMTVDNNVPYGIYRVTIDKQGYDGYLPQFNGYSTHSDIIFALNKGCTFSITAEYPNALVYDATKRLSGAKVFKDFVEMMFDLKQKGVSGAKEILNSLWGKLCKSKVYTTIISDLNNTFENEDEFDKVYNSDDEDIVINGTEFQIYNQIVDIRYTESRTGESSIFIDTVTETRYSTKYARLKPFLLALGRRKISTLIDKYDIGEVYAVQTDSFICEKPISNFTSSNELGCLRFEGRGHCKIINKTNVSFEEIIEE